MRPSPFGPADLEQLERRGISVEEALGQIEILSAPPRWIELDRPCALGDGIRTIPAEEHAELLGLHREAARGGRGMKFVPASGAATRMFDALLRGDAAAVAAFLENIDRFAFAEELRRVVGERGADLDELARRGAHGPILDALLPDDGLGYAGLPKALLAFHRYADGARTAFEEHMIEAAAVLANAAGRCRLHFTVSPEHLGRFEAHLREVRNRHERTRGVIFDVGFSAQSPATDTLAVDAENRPFRQEDGTLLFRPSGHGALIENLGALGADLVLIKNIDNVASDRLKASTELWSRLLIGLLVKLEREGAPDRPLRVCGMVRNVGEPGGAPFWVRSAHGEPSPQIVEVSQIDPASPRQQEILKASTHFNPVFMACAVRDRRGRPHDLKRYVDPSTAIVTRKSAGGRELKALERPGLWNGSMAGWRTVFVEVPGTVFNPVKTIHALLGEAHQPG